MKPKGTGTESGPQVGLLCHLLLSLDTAPISEIYSGLVLLSLLFVKVLKYNSSSRITLFSSEVADGFFGSSQL